jgi:uncharacterized protein YndB with AHSA1/START domain
MQNQITKTIELKAPVSRVWKALTDHRQFGEWFGVQLEGPFVVGQASTANVAKACNGRENVKIQFLIKKIEPEHTFSYNWHPYSVEPDVDYSKETPTLVEFTLAPTTGGTRLTVVESGFDKVPEHRRLEAFRMNTNGWERQMQNIEKYVSQTAQLSS